MLKNETLRRDADAIIRASLNAVLPDEAVRRALKNFRHQSRQFSFFRRVKGIDMHFFPLQPVFIKRFAFHSLMAHSHDGKHP